MDFFSKTNGGLEFQRDHIRIRVEPWGADSVRVRIAAGAELGDEPWALLPPAKTKAEATIADGQARLVNGKLTAAISDRGNVTISRTDNGQVMVQDQRWLRQLKPVGGGLFKAQSVFSAHADERIYGMGQRPYGFLDNKGAVLDLKQRNTEVCIPFVLSSRKYGFLWNNPAIGRVAFAKTGTYWTAEATRQIDYWVTVGDSYAEIMSHYADATGHAPAFPEWVSGFWQSKLRYRTQEELMAVAREHKRRGLPLDVIVVDYFHWTRLGDWKFDPRDWPDPAGMVRELDKMGVKVLVSVWPHVSANSGNYAEMQQKGLLARAARGLPAFLQFEDVGSSGSEYMGFYDPTNPEARRFIWNKVRENYHKIGIKLFWLDACEPEMGPGVDHDNVEYHAGNGLEVGCLFPFAHQQAFHEGLKAAGETEIITLCRSAWAGSQRFGAAVWSGDIRSTFDSLREQIKAGLNMACSGIPWWTTDIGGFAGGNAEDPSFRELLVRWFQYGTFCPLFRLHGVREPGGVKFGAPNEVWSYGEDVYAILKDHLLLREKMKPYIMKHMKVASEKGLPMMRPLFFDFEDDARAQAVEDQFMFGPDVLVAPVTEPGARSRKVYLPGGIRWREMVTGREHQGGQVVEAAAPLERMPVFIRSGALPGIQVSM